MPVNNDWELLMMVIEIEPKFSLGGPGGLKVDVATNRHARRSTGS